MSKELLETLYEQTVFLLEKQEELLKESLAAFDSIITLVSEKKENVEQNSEVLKDLQFIYEHIAKQKEVLNEPIQQDIDFLKDQLGALKKVKEIKDPEKAKELLDMMMEEDTNLLETDVFKEQVIKDLEVSKKDLDIMINDLKDAVIEGNWHTLRLTLEAMESTEEESSCSDSGCDSCSSCSGCSGVDIFEALKDLESDDKKS